MSSTTTPEPFTTSIAPWLAVSDAQQAVAFYRPLSLLSSRTGPGWVVGRQKAVRLPRRLSRTVHR